MNVFAVHLLFWFARLWMSRFGCFFKALFMELKKQRWGFIHLFFCDFSRGHSSQTLTHKKLTQILGYQNDHCSLWDEIEFIHCVLYPVCLQFWLYTNFTWPLVCFLVWQTRVSIHWIKCLIFWLLPKLIFDMLDWSLPTAPPSSPDFVVQEQHFPNPYEESFRCKVSVGRVWEWSWRKMCSFKLL